MGLKGDLHEVATVWHQSSWRVKGYLVLSVFLASGSIASLSDTVFQWKGFVNDAIMFYGTYISDPLFWVLRLGFPQVPEGASNLLILSALYVGANLRVVYFSPTGSRTQREARRAISTYIGGITALLIGNHLTGRAFSGESAIGLFSAGALCASVEYWRIGGAARILWFAHLFGPFALVGLTAAIVDGLGRLT